MKKELIFLTLISIISLSLSKPLPHFIYDGIESYRECLGEKDIITFSILGTLSEELDLNTMKVDDYFLEDMGYFKCFLQENEDQSNIKRKHKIFCQIEGVFERKGYILYEPKVSGFDFNNEYGESSWPEQPEKKSFLIGNCGEKVELNNEPVLMGPGAYSNPLLKVRKGVVEQALTKLPKRSAVDEANMCAAMKKIKTAYGLKDAETAYLVYRWLNENIVYDCYAFVHGGVDHSEKGTYNTGKGVCSGIALIFKTMCLSLGLDSEYVAGYTRNKIIPGQPVTKTDHAWNSVKIDGSYYLVEATWGSGTCDGDKYVKRPTDFYFCTNPQFVIRDHYPADQKWQLISPTITLQTFANMAKLTHTFYEIGFLTISPDKSAVGSKKAFAIDLTYDKTKKVSLLTHLYYLQGGTFKEQPNACFDTKDNGIAKITCITNYKGEYKLAIFGRAEPSPTPSYTQIAEYKVVSQETAAKPLGFPTVYGLYSSSDMKIISPLYTPLTKGAKYDFQFTTTTYDNLYLKNGDNNFLPMQKNGKAFTLKGVVINADPVRLCTKKGTGFSIVLDYNAK